jgi:WS/DGAT/MGAT family acyltransferase
MRQLTSLDAQFLAVETPRTYGHVGGLAIYDPSTAPGGELTRNDVCDMVAERLHLLPPFRQRLVEVPFGIDHPYWVEDPDFDLDFHVRDSAIPPPGDDAQLATTVERIFARPLDRSRPLWELYLIHGLAGGRVAMLTKIHHSVVDGVSGAEILGVLLDPSPEGRELPPRGELTAERVPGQLEMLGRGLLGLPGQPVRALRSIPATLPHIDRMPGLDMLPGAGVLRRATQMVRKVVPGADGGVLEQATATAPRTRFNGLISAHRRYAFGSVSLDTVKAIKNAAGVSVNDVVLAVCARAMREWLTARDELPREPLVAMVPVSVRSEEQAGTFGNRVSVMVVQIPTDAADAGEQLARTNASMRGAKDRHKALPADLMQDLTQFVPPAIHARASRVVMQISGGVERLRPPLNLVISNVPGPRMPLFCAGAKLLANHPVSVVADGVGLNITCMSYRDHIDFGIIADREQLPSAWELMDGITRALAEIEDAVCAPKRSPAPAKAKPKPKRPAKAKA